MTRHSVQMMDLNTIRALAAEQGTRTVHLKVEAFTRRIDRRSAWGNPYVLHTPSDPRARAACLLAYVRGFKDRDLEWVGQLRGEVLGCWCAPRPCHGDVLATLAAVDAVEQRREVLALWAAWLEREVG